jgi:hypothetical protein
MAVQRTFLQDRTALLLVSGNAFLTLATIVLILLKLDSGQGTTNYIVSYRSSLGIDRYTTGTVTDIWGFVLATVLIFAIGIVLGYRTHAVRRELSLVILVLTVLLLVFLIVVSNALLVLR